MEPNSRPRVDTVSNFGREFVSIFHLFVNGKIIGPNDFVILHCFSSLGEDCCGLIWSGPYIGGELETLMEPENSVNAGYKRQDRSAHVKIPRFCAFRLFAP
jgi:hypothetical protein